MPTLFIHQKADFEWTPAFSQEVAAAFRGKTGILVALSAKPYWAVDFALPKLRPEFQKIGNAKAFPMVQRIEVAKEIFDFSKTGLALCGMHGPDSTFALNRFQDMGIEQADLDSTYFVFIEREVEPSE